MTMVQATATSLAAFSLTLASTPVFKRWARARQWVDVAGSDPLKIHAAPVPFVGGLAITLGCLAPLAVGQSTPLLALIAALSLGCAALGLRDDQCSLPPLFRLAMELSIALALAIGCLTLHIFSGAMWTGTSAALGMFLVIVYVPGAINAINMQDGMDGLAAGIVLIGCAGFTIAGASLGQPLVLALALALGGSLAGFLRYNFHPASVFMGDNGAYFVGFMVATMALLLTFVKGTGWGALGAVLVMGIPIFDAGLAIVRRLAKGVSPFAGDRSHFYDFLVQRGLSIRAVAVVSYAAQACSVALGTALLLL